MNSQNGANLTDLLLALGLTTRRADLQMLGRRLAVNIGRPRPFSYNHLLSVAHGMQPSQALRRAIASELAGLDDAHPLRAGSEAVQVLAPAGQVHPGAYIMARSILCRDCLIPFVPNTPGRLRCPRCSPSRRGAMR